MSVISESEARFTPSLPEEKNAKLTPSRRTVDEVRDGSTGGGEEVVRLHRVNRRFGATQALKDVSLTVKEARSSASLAAAARGNLP